MRSALALLAACGLLAGCTTVAQNQPNPTATEQQLPAHAAEAMARGFDLRLPAGTRLYLDTSLVEMSPCAKYLIATVRAHLIGRGLVLVDRQAADDVLELRVSACGIDDISRVLGMPATTIPSLHVGVPAAAIPEVAIWSRHARFGVAEVHAVLTDAHTGLLVTALGPLAGVARIQNEHILTGIVLGDELERPGIRAGRP